MEDTRADIGVEYDRSVDIYGLAGFQFEIPYESFTIKPFISFSYSPASNGHYSVTPTSPPPESPER